MAEFYLDTLKNGLRLVTVQMPHLHSAEMVVYLGAGGRNEDPREAGIAHFLEHMLFRGTAEYPTSQELERAFETLGGAVNASTDAETTCFHSRFHPDHAVDGVALLASMLRRPLFQDIDIERRIILEEAREDFNEKGLQINPDNLMAELLWPQHPLGQSLIGSPNSLAALTLKDLRDFYRRHYIPGNIVLCCCGPVDRAQLLARTEEEFGDWQAAPLPAVQPVPAVLPAGPQTRWVKDSDSQITIQLAFRCPGRTDHRTLHLRVLRRLLSWGGSARLSVRLREELGLTYAVDANCSLLDDTGYLAIDLAVHPQNLETAIEELLRELQKLRDKKIPQDELNNTIRAHLFELDFSLDQPESQSIRYGWGLQANYLRTLEDERRELQALSPSELQQTAQEVFCTERLHLVVVGPWNDRMRNRIEALLASERCLCATPTDSAS
ncbi:MAG: insulinase family protein [Desulfuromonas sp.]|nr:MAG: insulinase family protein [Desulfuromonas sp.]